MGDVIDLLEYQDVLVTYYRGQAAVLPLHIVRDVASGRTVCDAELGRAFAAALVGMIDGE